MSTRERARMRRRQCLLSLGAGAWAFGAGRAVAESRDGGDSAADDAAPISEGIVEAPSTEEPSAAAAVVAESSAALESPVLVCVCLRGAADGLSLVPPFGDSAYYEHRKSIAIAKPGKPFGAIDLDGHFGLHPALGPLLPAYRAGELAVVLGVGSPHPTRSHFEAQDYLQTAVPGRVTGDGWLARCLSHTPAPPGQPWRALALTDQPPVALRGPAPVVTTPQLGRLALTAPKRVLPALTRGFTAMYQGRAGLAEDAGAQALALLKRLESLGLDRGPGASVYPKQAGALRELAALIKRGIRPQVAWLDVGGWDTHVAQGNGEGGLARLLEVWGQGLAAFRSDLGQSFERVTVLVMTEFGRTARENGTGGTDHGHASVMLLLGGPVQGGKLYGAFPGLGRDVLYEGRDLPVTTDFRAVFTEVAQRHFRVAEVDALFPGFGPHSSLGLFRS